MDNRSTISRCSTRQSVASPPSDLHFTQYKAQPTISQKINNCQGKPCTTTSSTSPDLHYQSVSNQAKTVAYVESHSFQNLGPLSRDSVTSPPSDWGPSSSSKREDEEEDERTEEEASTALDDDDDEDDDGEEEGAKQSSGRTKAKCSSNSVGVPSSKSAVEKMQSAAPRSIASSPSSSSGSYRSFDYHHCRHHSNDDHHNSSHNHLY